MTTAIVDKLIGFSPLSDFFEPSHIAFDWNKMLSESHITQSNSISSNVSDALIFLKKENVEIEDIASVENFLVNNYGLVSYLYEVPQKVSNYFIDASFKLDIFSDPDQDDDFQQIFLEIETHLSPKEANERLSKLNRDWLLKINDKDICLFNFSLNFA
jgi:hypothetical protein